MASSSFASLNNNKLSPNLSLRQGALAMRGIARFMRRLRLNKIKGIPSTSLVSGSNKSVKGNKAIIRKMSEKESYKCSPKFIEKMKKETLFNRHEIEALYKIFKKLITFNKSSNGMTSSTSSASSTSSVIASPKSMSEGIDRIVFREVLHNTFDIVTENVLMDRIFCVWDKLNCGLLTLENWFLGMSLFLKGDFIKQIDYCFAVYDLNSDGFITKDEMFQLLKNCLIKFPQEEDPEESVKDLVDIIIRKIDKDKDGKISLSDYQKTIKGEPLLLEAFGRCLPSEKAKLTFLTTLKF